MDISIGSYGKPSAAQRARHVWSRLTMRARALLAVFALLLLYFCWPFSGSGSGAHTGADSDIGSASVATTSELLNNPSLFNKITLSYLFLPPYLGGNNQYPNYANGGNMLLSAKSPFVRLTADKTERHGYLTSRSTISHKDLSAIEIEIDFKIHGKQERVSLIGDGMAVWLTSDTVQSGDVFGVSGKWDGMGILLDTYKNFNGKKNRNLFPYMSLQRNYGGDNFYDKSMDGLESQLGGCSINEIYNNDGVSKLRINYIRGANLFEVSIDQRGDGDWKVCYRNQSPSVVDYLPMGRNVHLAVSAETGQLHHIVDVYSIKVNTYRTKDDQLITELHKTLDDIQQPLALSEDKPEVKQKRRTMNRLRRQEKKLQQMDYEKYGTEHGFVGWFFGWVWSIIKVLFQITLLVGVAYAALVAFRVYKQKNKKKGGLL